MTGIGLDMAVRVLPSAVIDISLSFMPLTRFWETLAVLEKKMWKIKWPDMYWLRQYSWAPIKKPDNLIKISGLVHGLQHA